MILKNKKLKEVKWPYNPGIRIHGISLMRNIFLNNILQRCETKFLTASAKSYKK